MTNPVNARVRNWLCADFPGHTLNPAGPGLAEHARLTVRTAFPELVIPLHFVFLSSRRRDCRQLALRDGFSIAIDDGLISLLAVQDYLVRSPLDERIARLAALWPIAEAFLHNGALTTAKRCADACIAILPVLHELWQRGRQDPAIAHIRVFILLHECAHASIDADMPWTRGLTAWIDRVFLDYRAENERLLASFDAGRSVSGHNLAIVGSEPDLLQRQISEFLELTKDRREIIREASCDVLACVGMLRLYTGLDLLAADLQPSSAALHEIGDTVGVAMRTNRLLMARTFLAHTVEKAASRTDRAGLDRAFCQITARNNTTVNAFTELFRTVIEHRLFTGVSRQHSQATVAELENGFLHDIRRLQQYSEEQVFSPIEDAAFTCEVSDHSEMANRPNALAEARAAINRLPL